MDNSIRAILDMDKQARQMEEQAEQKRRDAAGKVEQRKQELQQAYAASLTEALSFTEEEQKDRVEKEKAAIEAHTQAVLSAMDTRVREQHDRWVQQLTAATLGQE